MYSDACNTPNSKLLYSSEAYNDDIPYWVDLPWEREGLPEKEHQGLLVVPYNQDCGFLIILPTFSLLLTADPCRQRREPPHLPWLHLISRRHILQLPCSYVQLFASRGRQDHEYTITRKDLRKTWPIRSTSKVSRVYQISRRRVGCDSRRDRKGLEEGVPI